MNFFSLIYVINTLFLCSCVFLFLWFVIELLDLICEWVLTNFIVCRIQDLTSLILTLATVNHIPSNADSLFAVKYCTLHIVIISKILYYICYKFSDI